jgi:hypothetical protein
MNGIQLKGVALHGASINGELNPQKLRLRGGELIAHSRRGITLGGEALEDATLVGIRSNNTTIQIRIDDVTPTADAEIYEYSVKYFDGLAWSNLCGENNGVPVRALALEGRWDESAGTATGGDHINDPNVFTFACKNAVTAKCVGMGYAPWRSITECNGAECQTISMRDMHQACTRMMRADYCGDGTPQTQNGTLINVWDNFGIQSRDVATPVNWTNEAEWSPKGATCIQQVRWSGAAETYIANHCPERLAAADVDCFSSDSTFFTSQGFEAPIGDRSLFRNQFTHDPH